MGLPGFNNHHFGTSPCIFFKCIISYFYLPSQVEGLLRFPWQSLLFIKPLWGFNGVLMRTMNKFKICYVLSFLFPSPHPGSILFFLDSVPGFFPLYPHSNHLGGVQSWFIIMVMLGLLVIVLSKKMIYVVVRVKPFLKYMLKTLEIKVIVMVRLFGKPQRWLIGYD